MTRLRFGLASRPSSGETSKSVDALAAWLRAHANLDLESVPSSTYEELVSSVRDGGCDVAWLPPVAYAWLAERVTPIGTVVRGGKTTYSAAIVVRESSPVRALRDITGLRAGWVDKWSAAGFVVPRLELVRAGILPSAAFRTEKFYGSHLDALRALGEDACDVVGTYARTPDRGEPATEGAWSEIDGLRVRVIATSGPIPSDVIAVRRNLLPREHELTATAFRRAREDDEGRALLRGLFGGDELHEGLDPGHDELRRAYESGVASGLFD